MSSADDFSPETRASAWWATDTRRAITGGLFDVIQEKQGRKQRDDLSEVEAVLAPIYPKVKGQMSKWSGRTGYIDYQLDERYTLSISSSTHDGKQVVHDDQLLLLYDWASKRRLDLKVYPPQK